MEVFGYSIWRILVAAVAIYVFLRLGIGFLRSLAAPQPEPPPPGEMRKVKITYRCDVCGTEVRMTMAPDEDPPPPKHCLEDMRLVTPID